MTTDPHRPRSMADVLPESAIPTSSGTTRGETDGRVATRLRNRERVIEALIELIDFHGVLPSMDALVEHSGISERSIFRYFNDLVDLSLTAIRSVSENAEPDRVIPDLGEGDFDHRIEQFVSTRIGFLVRLHNYGRIARSRLIETPEIQQGITGVLHLLREQVSAQFEVELEGLTEADQATLIDTLLTAFSFEGFDVMWRQLENDVDAVADRWRALLHAMLTPST